jgi:CBS domain-containing protein
MNVLKVADVPPTVVAPTTTVMETIQAMVSNRVGAAAVMDQGSLIGIFSERDVMTRVVLPKKSAEKILVAEVMSSPVQTITPEMSGSEALALMVERHIRHLPIVDQQGKVLGMLSIRNLLQRHVEDLSDEISSLDSYLTADGIGG